MLVVPLASQVTRPFRVASARSCDRRVLITGLAVAWAVGLDGPHHSGWCRFRSLRTRCLLSLASSSGRSVRDKG